MRGLRRNRLKAAGGEWLVITGEFCKGSAERTNRFEGEQGCLAGLYSAAGMGGDKSDR